MGTMGPSLLCSSQLVFLYFEKNPLEGMQETKQKRILLHIA